MHLRIFFILIGIIVLSLASGLGLNFALAWVEPTASPPGDNVPAPINVGSGAQTKAGSLTIGGVFTVVGAGSGAVIGNPTGGNKGPGSLNAEQLCIQGVCLTNWTIANAFVQGGNTFGELAVLGTKDNYDLSIITANTEKIRVTAGGNVGIGTTPRSRLDIGWGIGAGKGFRSGDYLEINELENYNNASFISWNAILNGTGLFVPVYNPGSGMVMTMAGDGVGSLDFYGREWGGSSTPVLLSDFTHIMRLGVNGNVGIGTTAPASKLHINGGSLKLAYTAGNTPHELISYNNAHSLWAISPTTTSRFVLGTALNWDTSMNFEYTPGAVGAGNGLLTIGQLYKNAGTFTHGITALYTNGLERMRIGSNGNVAIGTTNTTYNLMIGGSAPRIYLLPTAGTNPELDFGSPAMDTHWAIYRDTASDELRFWRGDNNVTVTAAGDINSRRCFGPVYVGQTAATYDGARGGYDDADALCAAAFAGSHICRTSEILETVKCNRASLPTADMAWIANGPPGYTARANDCKGWTSNTGSGAEIAYGSIWAFDANGGVGWVTTCNMSLKFACCR